MPLIALVLSLLLATVSASNGFEQYAKRQDDLPNISSLSDVVGASTTKSSTSAKSTSASSTQASSTASSASQTTNAATTAASTTGTSPPLPSLYGVGAPALIVPDTSNAPFMHKSALPEGTVFICVGAILGFLAICVLAWRGLVAYSLHRSVQRASTTAYAPDSKYGGHARSESNYHNMYSASNVSLEYLQSQKTGYTGAGANNHVRDPSGTAKSRRTSRVPSGAAASSLFFSPTATANNGAGAASNRSSSFLPAGYYAAGASAIGGPTAAGYGRVDTMDSTLDSPGLRTSTAGMGRPGSSGGLQATGQRQHGGERRSNNRFAADNGSNLSLPNGSQQTSGRTPSAYMEDLFSEHGYGPRERF